MPGLSAQAGWQHPYRRTVGAPVLPRTQLTNPLLQPPSCKAIIFRCTLNCSRAFLPRNLFLVPLSESSNLLQEAPPPPVKVLKDSRLEREIWVRTQGGTWRILAMYSLQGCRRLRFSWAADLAGFLCASLICYKLPFLILMD